MMPSVPDGRLAESWTLAAETSETRFELPTMRVVGHTRLYDDTALREAVRERTGIDRRWRFFFATRLAFEPSLAPGIGPAMLYGSVSAEAKRAFAADLSDRGFEAVSRGHSERVRTETGDRAALTKYDARYRLDLETASGDGTDPETEEGAGIGAENGDEVENSGGDEDDRSAGATVPNDTQVLPVTGWLGIWIHDGEFRLAGGAYPDRPLAEVLGVADDRLETGATVYREELLDLIRAVR